MTGKVGKKISKATLERLKPVLDYLNLPHTDPSKWDAGTVQRLEEAKNFRLFGEGQKIPSEQIASEAGHPELATEVDKLIVRADLQVSYYSNRGVEWGGLFGRTKQDEIEQARKGKRRK